MTWQAFLPPSPKETSHTASVTDFDTLVNANIEGVWLMTDYVIPGMLSPTHGPDLLNTARPFATST